ncbi:MAG: carbon-nitrogen hydrolase family protein [Armatimonadetes bacterium]|nr:carbon-nitrogen hydrolase family protein [Armatimonadota bacterium]
MIRVACAQLNVAFGNPETNLERALTTINQCRGNQADLIVFPECFLTGYCVDSLAEARSIAISIDSLEPLREACVKEGATVIVGFAEQDADRLYNSAALIEPDGKVSVYRKTHLPHLGLDRFVSRGDQVLVADTAIGRIGVFICFDLRPPELARCMAIAGAQLLVLPTNWPVGANGGPNIIAPARANENKVFLATCNRAGNENGFHFIGQSGIYSVFGALLAQAGEGEEIIYADLELGLADEKQNVMVPGKYETNSFTSRRPELYKSLLDE